jgi:hypothetical protein
LKPPSLKKIGERELAKRPEGFQAKAGPRLFPWQSLQTFSAGRKLATAALIRVSTIKPNFR